MGVWDFGEYGRIWVWSPFRLTHISLYPLSISILTQGLSYIAQVGLGPLILLVSPPSWWDYKHGPLYWLSHHLFCKTFWVPASYQSLCRTLGSDSFQLLLADGRREGASNYSSEFCREAILEVFAVESKWSLELRPFPQTSVISPIENPKEMSSRDACSPVGCKELPCLAHLGKSRAAFGRQGGTKASASHMLLVIGCSLPLISASSSSSFCVTAVLQTSGREVAWTLQRPAQPFPSLFTHDKCPVLLYFRNL